MSNFLKSKTKWLAVLSVAILTLAGYSTVNAAGTSSTVFSSTSNNYERGKVVNQTLLELATDVYTLAFEMRVDAVSIQKQTEAAIVEALKAENEREDIQGVTAANMLLAREIFMLNKMTAKNLELSIANKAAAVESNVSAE